MLKRLVLYPFLFISYVILSPLVYNLGELDPSQALRPLLLLFLAAAVGFLLLYGLFKDGHYAGYLVFLFLMFFFVYGHLSRVIQDWLPGDRNLVRLVLLVIWGCMLAILGLKKLWLRFGGAGRITPLLNLCLSAALLIQGFTAFGRMSQAARHLSRQVEGASMPTTGVPLTLDCATKPDIYYLILDGYGRADVLENLYGVDNAPFLDSLQHKGFTIASQSYANYTQTVYSIPSALNFTYLAPEPEGVSGLEYFTGLVASNQIMRLLKGCGYRTVAFETGFSFTNHTQADVYLSSGSKLSEFENLLLAGSPLEVLLDEAGLGHSGHGYQAHRERVLFAFEQLRELPGMPGPKFVFAHIISPHPPFVFDAGGKPIEPGRAYSIADGDDYRGSWEEYRKGYAGQVQFVNQMLEKTIDAILAGSPTPPIIIIQGDHGPGGFLDWDSPQRTCLWERTSILNAYYLPGAGDSHLYPTISPVNSFRVILNAYFRVNLEMLPDRSYFTSHRLIRQVIDVTEERDSTNNCALP